MQREMQEWVRRYPGLYGAEAFDPAMYSTLALAFAFSAPDLDAAALRTASKVNFWVFALDWIADCATGSRAELDPVLERVRAVAAGEEPTDELTAFFAEIRDELDSAAPELRGFWRRELERMLVGMAVEVGWKTSGELPDLTGYLANADNIGFAFVNAGHWIGTGGTGDPDAVRAALRAAQKVLRLLNDLASVDRDRKWGDLNVLLLGVPEEEVRTRLAELRAEADALLPAVPAGLADYLERQMDFCVGFYGTSDFWVAR